MNLRFIDDKEKKFTDVYSKFYSVVSGTIYTKINNYDTTEDLTQEVFLRFYNKLETIENPRKWLLGALRNVVLEFFKQKSHTTVDIDDIFDDVNVTYTNGFRDARIIIAEAIENDSIYKNDTERILFELIAVQNYSYLEVKRELGLSVHIIQYHYTRICKKIAHELKQRGIDNIEDLL